MNFWQERSGTRRQNWLVYYLSPSMCPKKKKNLANLIFLVIIRCKGKHITQPQDYSRYLINIGFLSCMFWKILIDWKIKDYITHEMDSNWDEIPQDYENVSVNDLEMKTQGLFWILFLNLTVLSSHIIPLIAREFGVHLTYTGYILQSISFQILALNQFQWLFTFLTEA